MGLPRAVLDHELLVELERHLVAARGSDDRAREGGRVEGQPLGDLPGAKGLADRLEWLSLTPRGADLDPIARLAMEGGDVRRAAVDGEVAVRHELSRVVARGRDSEPEDDVVEPKLEDPQEVLAGHAGAGFGLLEIVVELALEDAIDAADLLLLAELEAIVADLAASDAVLARRRRTPLEGALLGVAARALQEELRALAAAESADRTGVSSHDASPGLDAAPLGRAAAVVRDGRHVSDRGHFETRGLERADRLLPARARTLHVDLDLAHPVLHRLLGSGVGR